MMPYSKVKEIAKELCDKSPCHHKCCDTTECVVEDDAKEVIANSATTTKYLPSALTNEDKVSEKGKYIKLEDLQKFPIRKDHYDKEHGSEKFIFGVESVLEYAEYLPTYDVDAKSEWIRVEDRLPEKEGKYLICNINGYVTFGYFGDFDGDGKIKLFRDNPRFDYRNVFYWMPLPEAPKMKGGEE